MLVIRNEAPTITLNVAVSDSAGAPLSVARIVNEFVPTALAVQEKTPFVVPIAAPAGTFPTKSNTMPWAGKSGSATCAGNEPFSPTAGSQSAMAASTGGLLLSFTIIVMDAESLFVGVPSSVTRTVT